MTAHNDFNGDGRSDILWRGDEGTMWDWLSLPNGAVTSNYAKFYIHADSNWQIIGTGDFNGDGSADLLWRSNEGIVTDWLGQSDGSFFNNWANFTIQADPSWHVIAVADFNGDKKDDILWQNSTDGTITDWLGQSNGSFVNNWSNFHIQASSNWHVIGTGDFNGDGRNDIIWRSDSGIVTDWLGQSDGSFFNNWSNFTIEADSSWRIVATGDFNGDKVDDLIWRSDSGIVTEWLGQPDGTFLNNWTNFMIQADANWHIVGTGDFNGDGRSDILWRNDTGQLNEWYGQLNGGFEINTNFSARLDNHWHVEDSFFF